MKQVLHLNAESLVGVERATGKLLWRVPLKTNAKRHVAMPLPLDGNRVVVCSHTFGMLCLKIARSGAEWKATEDWLNKDLKVNLATSVAVGNHLYSHGAKKDFVCVDARTGVLMWSGEGFGKEFSSTLAIGDRLLVLTDSGELALVSGDPSGFKERSRVQVCCNTWSFPDFSNGQLFVRDRRELSCIQLLER
ncbi:MAG: hypothetical protein EXS31_16905 [Pedosphaera sp.]|nr:hypothetical protein [Pedosphaera sp.]